MPFNIPTLHLRRFKCFFQLLRSLHFIPFAFFSFSLFALVFRDRFFSRVRSCVRLYMILPHSPSPSLSSAPISLLRSFVACKFLASSFNFFLKIFPWFAVRVSDYSLHLYGFVGELRFVNKGHGKNFEAHCSRFIQVSPGSV